MSPNNAESPPEEEAVQEECPISQRQTNEYHWNYLFHEPQDAQLAFKPTLGQQCYTCYACRSLFGLKYSFQMHMNRRVVLLKYFCAKCNENLLFYNRCTFLHHCRQHFGLYEGEIHLDKMERKILSNQLVGFTRQANLAYLFDEEECALQDTDILNPQFYSPLPEDKGKTVVRLKSTHLLINKIHNDGQLFTFALKQIAKNIPKCVMITQQELSELWSRLLSAEEHRIQIKTEVDQEMVTFTDVSYPPLNEASFNENITSSSSDVSSDGMSWTVPVITKIETIEEYPTRDERKRCSECNFMFTDLAQHFLGDNKPSDENLRCGRCNLILPTVCALKAHLRTHDKVVPFVCPDCGCVFLEHHELVDHLENVCFHTCKSVRFRCPGKCGKLFASTKTFGYHFRTVHIDTYFLCSVCNDAIFETLRDCELHVASHEDGSAIGIKRFSCHLPGCAVDGGLDGYKSRLHVEKHVKDLERCIYIYTCKLCKAHYRSVQTMSAHLVNCRIKKRRRRSSPVEIEPNCKECTTCRKIMINPKHSQCHQCANTFKLNPEKECICVLCKERIHYKDRRIHQMSCKYSKPQILVEKMDLNPAPSEDSDIEQNVPEKRQKVDVDLTVDCYQCAICKIGFDDRQTFHNHLKNHRSLQTFQCMECGVCFPLRHALMKHLLNVHKVTNYEKYFSSNDCYDGTPSEVNNVGEI